MSEHRTSDRVRTILRAVIIFNNRNSSIDCTVRNLSRTGAKIIVEETVAIPQQFELQIPQKGRTFTARVAWRHGNETGVEFVDEMVGNKALPVGTELADRLRELERENAALKKKCADLQAQLSRYMECA